MNLAVSFKHGKAYESALKDTAKFKKPVNAVKTKALFMYNLRLIRIGTLGASFSI
jgi:hypothetical protein